MQGAQDNFFSLDIINSKEIAEVSPYVFTNNKYQKYKVINHMRSNMTGLPLLIVDSEVNRISLVLKKHNTNTFGIIYYSWATLRLIKISLIHTKNIDASHRLLFRSCDKNDLSILFYQEHPGIIQIRSLLSFKVKKSFDLLKICKALNVESSFASMRVCVDAVYTSSLGSVLLCLKHMVVICEEESRPTILYELEEDKMKDRFISLRYDHQKATLLAERVMSIMLFRFDSGSACETRVFKLPWMENLHSRIVDWDAVNSLMILARTSDFKKEDLLVFRYFGEEIRLIAWVREKMAYSASYCASNKQLVYIDDNMLTGKQIRSVVLSDLIEEQEDPSTDDDDDDDKLVEGELLAPLPDINRKLARVSLKFNERILMIRFYPK